MLLLLYIVLNFKVKVTLITPKNVTVSLTVPRLGITSQAVTPASKKQDNFVAILFILFVCFSFWVVSLNSSLVQLISFATSD